MSYDPDVAFNYDLEENVKQKGAIGDSFTHPLSDHYSTLAEAQVYYPEAISLSDEIDLCAILRCLAITQQRSIRGGTIKVPFGWYRANRSIDVSGCICWRFSGEGSVWRNYSTVAPASLNNAASTIAYVGPAGGSLFTHDGAITIGNYRVRGGAFENLQLCATNEAGNVLVRYHNAGQGAFFHNCFFGGGDVQVLFSGISEPYDTYFTECHFSQGNPVPTPGVEYRPNYGFFSEAGVYWGSQSTTISKCTMRYHTVSHIHTAGQCGLLIRDCTLESTYNGPSIVCKNSDPTNGGRLEVSGCHWESIFSSAYWNGTYYQYSIADPKRACTIEIGTEGSALPFFFRCTNSCSLNVRIPPTVNQIHGFVLYGQGPRAIIDGLDLSPALQRALVWRNDSPNYVDVMRLGGTYNPTDGDFLVSGPTPTTRRQREVTINGFPATGALWDTAVVPAYTNVTWVPYHITGVRALSSWQSVGQAPTAPFKVVRDILLDSPSDLGSAGLDDGHKNYSRGDTLRLATWRGGTPQNIGYGTRYAILCGANNVAASNAPGSWFPLVTGPGVSADKGNTNLNWLYSTDETEFWFNTPLTAERTVTMSTWSYTIPNGARLRLVRTAVATGDYDLVLVQSNPAVEVFRLRAGQWVEVMCDGGGSGNVWKVMASGPVENETTIAYEFRRPQKWRTSTDPGAPVVDETSIGGGKVYTYAGYFVGGNQVVGARQAAGAALPDATLGGTYGAAEQTALQALYNRTQVLETILRVHGLLED